MEGERDVIGTEKYRKFSQKMENVGRTLEVIAEELGRVFSENAAKGSGKRIRERESVLCLYRHSHEGVLDQKPPSDSEKNCKSCDHALSLHLPVKQAEFCVQSERGPLSFDTGPDTIVVTAGELLEEWSLGEFKFVSGEMIFEPDIHESQASLFIELKCSPLTLNHELNKISKTISLVDQLFIVLIVAFLYKFVVFISSQFT
ncbi:hypothetical protein L1049_009136 [Liquidambar formosana]|uniref:Uncharacterized protein n=1 Tax=Liquidambar formosana TaxID=63359 RepID=A0AAP0SAX2_LIQFO